MAARSKVLPVPYFVQPDHTTCQSTVLKMMAAYLQTGDPAAQRTTKGEILSIKKKINEDPNRPQKKMKNAHENFRWWLQEKFPQYEFERASFALQWEAIDWIVQHIDDGFPVITGVNHERVDGHIILIVGYRNFRPNQSSLDLQFVVHDPYGKFDPSLKSKQYGNQRMDGAACAASGGEIGPGQAVTLGANEVGRHKPKEPLVYYLLSAKRKQTVVRL
jgi:hypothetical protein